MPNERQSRYPEIPGLAYEDRKRVAAVVDPPPILSKNAPVVYFVLYKELSGYPTYGNPSRNADILYTGNRGVWTFDNPAFLLVPGNQRATLGISMILDDHFNVPVDRYSAVISINGMWCTTADCLLPHGSPAGGIFTQLERVYISSAS